MFDGKNTGFLLDKFGDYYLQNFGINFSCDSLIWEIIIVNVFTLIYGILLGKFIRGYFRFSRKIVKLN